MLHLPFSPKNVQITHKFSGRPFFIFIQFTSCKSRREVLSEEKIFSSETLESEAADAELLRYLEEYGVSEDEKQWLMNFDDQAYSGYYEPNSDEGFALRGGSEHSQKKNAIEDVKNTIKSEAKNLFVITCAQAAFQFLWVNRATGRCKGVSGPIRGKDFTAVIMGEKGSFNIGVEASVTASLMAFDIIPAGFKMECNPSVHNKIGSKSTSAASKVAQKVLARAGKTLNFIKRTTQVINKAKGAMGPLV